MKFKLTFILLFTILCCLSSSYAFIDRTSDYSVTIPDSFTKQTNEGEGNRYNSGTYTQSTFAYRTVLNNDLSNSYVEDIYSEEMLDYLDSMFKGNLNSDPNLVELTFIDKKITTYNNYNAFYLCYLMDAFNYKFYLWEYIILSDSLMYEISYTSPNKEYINSQEAKSIEDSFQILDSISFHNNKKNNTAIYNTSQITDVVSPEPTTFDDSSSYNISNYNEVPYGHLFVEEYIDYICIFILLIIIAVILGNAIIKSGKKLKALWLIVLMFALQTLSIFGAMLEKRLYAPSLNVFSVAAYFGYFLFSIGAIVILLVQYIQSKK